MPIPQRVRRVGRAALALLLALAALPVVLAFPSGTVLAGPSPVFTMFIPFTEQQISDGLFTIYPAGTPQQVVTTIDITSAADGSIMYWDHWEDGYEADIANPVQPTTEVWGDGDLLNGAAPGVPGDIVDAGTVILLQNNVVLPRNPATVLFDGRDKVASTRGFALARAGWDSGLGTLHAGAVATTDLSKYGTQFAIPVGENIGVAAFNYTGVSVMASDDNTTVEFDTNGDGTVDQTTVLNEGETAFVNGGVNAGGTVEATKPIQAHLMTGERNATYEGRWFELFPQEIRGDEYVAAAGSTSGTQVVTIFLQNPGSSSITVAVDAEGVANDTNLVIAPGAVASYNLPNGSGAQFSSPGNPFIAVSATVAEGTRTHWYDWGYSLVPTASLTPGVVVGWGAGNPSGDDNNSPVWVAPLADTTLYVDVDGDAVVDQTIPNVDAFESVQIVDLTDNDMTGARIYTIDGTLISSAWGQDPALDECCDAYDLGTAVLPTTSLVTTKTAEIVVDVNGDGNLNPGDTLEYTIRSVDAGALSLTNVVVQDTLPSTLVYVPNSTTVDGVPEPDDTVGTPFPVDGAGVTIPVLPPGAAADVTFRAQLVDPFPPFVQTVRNSVITTADQAAANATSIVPVVIPDLYIGKTSNAPGPLLPGQVFDYDIEVSNVDVGPQTGIDVTDALPPDLTWVATTVTRWIDDPAPGGSDVLNDPFTPQAYDNNPTEWTSNWVETDAGGGGATGGNVMILSELGDDRLRLRGGNSVIRRSFDGAAWDEASLSYLYRPDALEAGDWVSFQISTTGGSSWIELDRVIGPLTAPAYSPITYDMTRYLGQDIDIRWVTSPGFSTTDDSFYVDEVEVAVNDRIQEVVAGAAPPSLYTNGELLTGESLIVNLSVQVDPGIDPTTDVITNVASAVSTENTSPVVSDATDPVARASVGDTVWHDQDGDGVVDGGEPRLAGVTVELRDSGGVPIATDVTDASGNYLFADLDPGDYTVLVTAGVPAGMATTFDADGGYDETTDVTLGFGVDDRTTNFGYAIPVALGDRVFADVNGDAVENGTDFGIDGLDVTLTGPSHPGGTTTTTSSGTYGFSNLLPGTYTVDVDTSPLSTAAYSTTGGDSQVVVLTSGTDDLTVDFGYVLPAAIGDTVFHDLDADGIQDPGEPGFVGVTVTATGTGLPVGGVTTVTDATGYYLFANLDAGDFTITVSEGTGDLPVGYDASTPGGLAQNVTVTDEEVVLDADFGFYTQATIGDFVFEDVNGNGAWDTGEPGIDGVPITVTGPSFPGGTTVFTAGGGAYDVTVDPGTYTVVPDTSGFPAGTLNTLDGASPSVTVASTDDVDTADFGYAFPAFIGDFVFHDLDNSGSWDPGEPGLPGVDLTLTGGSLPPGGITTTTAADGMYLFTNVAPGTYSVDVDTATVPAGYVVSTGGDGIGGILVTSGSSILGIDFGYRGTSDLGDLVFHDLNDDGDHDAGEPGLPGVVVTLTGPGIAPGTTDTTDAGGNYLFADLDPGTYTVTVDTGTVPAGYTVTAGGDSRVRTLVSDSDDLTADLGYATTATIGDLVWDDLDGDGVFDAGEPGSDGVTLTLDDGVSPPVTLDTVAGAYDFTGVDPGTYTVSVDLADLPPGVVSTTGGASQVVTVVSDQDENDVDFGFYRPASVGDRLWHDLDGDGVQDAGEPGFPFVVVTLTGPGVPPGVTDVTDANGDYDFFGVPPNTYTVTLTASDIPAGVVWTYGGGLSQVTTIESGEDENDIDFGFYIPITIGDTVFYDIDGDGTQDAGEWGLAGVTMTLSGAGIPPGTTDTTDANGNYAFAGLAPGTYTVTLDTADLPAGSLSTTGGFVTATTVVSGGDDLTLDFGVADPVTIGDLVFDDLDGDGVEDAGEPGLAGVDVTITGPSHPGGTTVATDGTGFYEFTGLLPGDYTVVVDTGDVPPGYSSSSPTSVLATYVSGDDVDTVDFGFTLPAALGDFVFEDLDANGAWDFGEPGLAGVTLELTGPGVPPGTTVTTAASGAYSFGSLDPGTYTVTVTGAPAGYTNTLGGPSQVVVLQSGETDDTVDFGFYLGASIGDALFEDLDGDGVQDAGEPGVGGVTVTLDDGVATIDQDTVAGAYDFVGLTPDTYDVTIDTGDLPAGAVVTLGAAGYSLSVNSGDDEDDADFGFYVPGSIGDYVWDDLNGDGLQNDGPPSAVGSAGVDVTVFGPSFPGGTTVTTDANGGYTVTGLAPGLYDVVVDTADLPAGSASTTGGFVVNSVDITSGENEDTIDFGVAVPAGVGDLVYSDNNGNGVFDAGDAPLAGVVIDLTGPSFPLGTIDVTDAAGGYGFAGLLPGGYTVTVLAGLPAGAFSTTGGDVQLVTLSSGETDDTIDFGYAEPASIGDTLFHDLDNDGVQDPGDPGLANVDITIVGPSHPGGLTIPTGPAGAYAFTNLAPGSYTVTVDTADPDMNPAFVSTTGGDAQATTIVSGENLTTVDFGYTAPGTIGDLVFVDDDADGSQAGETGLAGVTLTLTGGSLPPGGVSTTTDGSGGYSFPNVLPGSYTVTVTGGLPAGAFSTTGGDAQAVTITSGQTDDTIDFGYAQPATIGDFVFDDLDGDGAVDGGEPGFPAVDVTITGPSHPGGFTTATDGAGGYSFGLLTPGTYTITVDTADLPAGAVNTLGGPSRVVTVGSGDTDLTADFGYTLPATIGDFVFEDLNGDGTVDAGEPGYDAVDVTITGPSHPGGLTIQTVAGAYDFGGLAPGTYTVTVDTADLPAGAVNTLGGAGRVVTIVSGQDENDADFGYYEPATLGDYVWEDVNGDGVQNDGPPATAGIAGVDVTVTGPSFPGGTTVTTDATGGYDVGGLAPGTYTVDVPLAGPLAGAASTTGGTTQVVVVTSGADENDADFGVAFPATIGDTVYDDGNGNGIEEPGDTGFAAVDVTIVGPSHPGGLTVATDGTGTYTFGGLLPGSYTVTVDTADLPAGSTSTTGGDAQVAVVTSGQTVDTVDFGYAVPASIGDQLFVDNDADGTFGAGDTGIADVDVTITGPGLPVGGTTVTTGPTGTYGITGLVPGTFTVTVDTADPDFDPAWSSTTGGDAQVVALESGDVVDTVDFGYAAPAAVGDTVFEDLDGDGVQDAGEPGIAGLTVTLTGGDLGGPVTTTTDPTGGYSFTGLTPGDYVVSTAVPGWINTTGGDIVPVTLVSGETDDTVDFGYAAPAVLGDTIFHDLDADGTQDAGEPGLAGIDVTLTGPSGPATVTTDGSGGYSFTGLVPGSYTVTVDTADLPTPAYASTTGGDATATVLTSGETENDIDFGYAAPATIGDLVWDDLDGDGTVDAGEPGFGGVTVTLDDGVSPPLTQDTIAGSYLFTGLVPGTYTVTVDTADLPAGVVNTYGGAAHVVVVQSAEDVDTADFGYYRPGSIGDLVFVDDNGNGTINIGELGLDGVEVTLTGAPLGAPLVTTTSGGGAYSFTGLAPGTYTATLTAGVPAGATSTTGGNATTVTIVSGEARLDVDFGLAQNVSVGDRVWHDLNDDGVQDVGEPGLGGVTLELRDVFNTVVATSTSDGAGAYLFTDVAPGAYTVVVDTATVPAGYTPSTPESFPITVTSGNDISTVDVGYVTTGSIGDLVWDDVNGNGAHDAGEPGIDGLTVTLTGGSLGGPLITATAGGGIYGFGTLDPGTYTVTVSPPPTGASTTGGDAQAVSILSDEDRLDVDFGYALAASIGDRVWHDLDRDGVQDAGEPGIGGVEMTLTGPSGPATTTTDGLGDYVFPNLLPGTYDVTFDPATVPVGAVSGAPYAPTTAGTVNVAVQSGDTVLTADIGFATTGTISGTIFEDDDADGVEEPGESGLPAITMELVDGGGTVVATVTTDGSGDYTFTGVDPGAYTVRVDASTVPAGFAPTSPDAIPVTVESDEAVTDVDVGYARPATIGDLVWHDLDADGVRDAGEPGIAAVDVELVDGGGSVVATETTDGAGAYSFTGVAPGSYTVRVDLATVPVGANSGVPFVATAGVPTSVPVTVQSGEAVDTADFAFHTTATIGDRVWHDLNADGAEDGGEPGLVVTVELVDGGGSVVASTPTAADGSYSFSGILPGTYDVRVTGVPGGYSSTTGNNPSTVAVVSDEEQLDIDFGFALLTGGSIGNEIWEDLDGDGVRDAGEPGITGVTVDLYDGGGVFVDTRTTPVTGAYVFTNLGPGSYEVRVDPSTLPAGYAATTAGGDTQPSTLLSGQVDLDRDFGYAAPATVGDLVWHDLDGDGVRDAGEPGIAGVVVELRDAGGVLVDSATTGAAGAYSLTAPIPGDHTVVVDPATTPVGASSGAAMTPTTPTTFAITLTSNENRDDLDVGYVTTASIGDTIFDDLDGDGVQDPGEPGLPGVSVILTDGGGSTTTAVTGPTGRYDFPGLAPGAYTVSVDGATLPAGSVATTTSSPVAVSVESDEVVDDVDLGYALPASLAGIVFTDADGDGTQSGDSGVTGVAVDLLDDGGAVVASTTTGAGGAYLFGGLLPGDYAVRPALPAGFSFTVPDAGDDALDSDVLPPVGTTATIAVTSGAAITDVDAGIFEPATVGDTVWIDVDGDGVQDPGEPGHALVPVELRDAGGALVAATVTDGNGNYSFTVVPGPYDVSITVPSGYRVATGGDVSAVTLLSGETDLDVDFGLLGAGSIAGQVAYDVGADGTIDPGDHGHGSVTVRATWEGPDEIAGTADDHTFTTTTATDGSYLFGDLPPGAYEVVVDPITLPDGLIEPTVDPDGVIDLVTTVANNGSPVTGVDFATTGTASLGDNVFRDDDEDGVLDPGEPGVGGVTVTATVTTAGGVVTYTTVTDASGFYEFTDLPAGDYVVTLDPTTIPVGLVPTILTLSTTLVINGADDSLDLALVPRVGPTAVDDGDATEPDTPVIISVLDNDSVVTGTTVTVTTVTPPSSGTATIDPGGTVTYTPGPGFTGTAVFTYTICDLDGLATFGDNAATRSVFCSTATVTVDIPPPDPTDPLPQTDPDPVTPPPTGGGSTPTGTTPTGTTPTGTTPTGTTPTPTATTTIPRTGSNPAPIQALALGFLVAGLVLLVGSRRRRPLDR